MTEVLASVDAVFSSPDFNEVWRNRVDNLYQLQINREKLIEALREFYKSSDTSEDDVEWRISGTVETLDAETLAEIHGEGSSIVVYSRLVEQAGEKSDELNEALVATVQGLGLGEFALLGLSRYVQRENSTEKLNLEEKVKATEQKLVEFDNYIRSNSGNLLTYYNFAGVYGAILGEGVVSVTDKGSLEIPIADNSAVYAMSHDGSNIELYQEEKLQIDSYAVLDSRTEFLHSWNPLLRVPASGLSYQSFAVGPIVEGPLHLATSRQIEGAEFYLRRLERARRVGSLATASAPPNAS